MMSLDLSIVIIPFDYVDPLIMLFHCRVVPKLSYDMLYPPGLEL